jgi:hypothetical protein
VVEFLMIFMPRFLHFDRTIIALKRGNTSLNKEGLQFSDTGDRKDMA